MFDIAIIGGGVVGANILCFCARRGVHAVLIEKNNDVATGASKANSGIIHAGFDAKPGTLKAKLNVSGNKIMEKLCSELDLPYKKIGALVVGNDLEKLNELKDRGDANGVHDLEIIKKTRLHELEPNLSPDYKYALYAKKSGIISPYMLTVALCEEAILNGATVYRNFETKAIEKTSRSFKIISTSETTVTAKYIVNCAGAGYNDIAKKLKSEIYPLTFRRGEYYLLDSSEYGIVNHTIFPLPTPESKGILVTPTIDGNILVGPTSDLSDNNIPTTTADGLNRIKASVSTMVPNLNLKKSIRVFSGIRTISGEDFIIEKSQKVKNAINIAGICSPGLSSAPAIANLVLELTGYDKLPIKKFKKRKNIISLKDKSKDEINALIKRDPDYGQIVCKCEMVSLAEIKQALKSPLPAYSVDGVKRRVRAGMGRCQGGFCLLKVIETIAKTQKVPMTNVPKENIGSEILISEIRPKKVVKNGKKV